METTSIATFVSAGKRIRLPLSDATPQVLSAIFHFQKIICLIDGTTAIVQSENGIFEGIVGGRVYTVIGDCEGAVGGSKETMKVDESAKRQLVEVSSAEKANSVVANRREKAVALFSSFEENFRAGTLIECVQASLSRMDYKNLRRHVGEKLHVMLDSITLIKSAPLSALSLKAIAIATSRLDDSTFRAQLLELIRCAPDAFKEATDAMRYIATVLANTPDDILEAQKAIKMILKGATSQQKLRQLKRIQEMQEKMVESSKKCGSRAITVKETFDKVLQHQNSLAGERLLSKDKEEKVLAEMTKSAKNLKAKIENDEKISKENTENIEKWLSEIEKVQAEIEKNHEKEKELRKKQRRQAESRIRLEREENENRTKREREEAELQRKLNEGDMKARQEHNRETTQLQTQIDELEAERLSSEHQINMTNSRLSEKELSTPDPISSRRSPLVEGLRNEVKKVSLELSGEIISEREKGALRDRLQVAINAAKGHHGADALIAAIRPALDWLGKEGQGFWTRFFSGDERTSEQAMAKNDLKAAFEVYDKAMTDEETRLTKENKVAKDNRDEEIRRRNCQLENEIANLKAKLANCDHQKTKVAEEKQKTVENYRKKEEERDRRRAEERIAREEREKKTREERVKQLDVIDESYKKEETNIQKEAERHLKSLEELHNKITQTQEAERNAMEERFSRIIEMNGLNLSIAKQSEIANFLSYASQSLGSLQKEWSQLHSFFESISTAIEDSFAKSIDSLVRKYEDIVASVDDTEEDVADAVGEYVEDIFYYTKQLFVMIHEIVSMTRVYSEVSAEYVTSEVGGASMYTTLNAEDAEHEKKKICEKVKDVRQKVDAMLEKHKQDRASQLAIC